MPKLFEDGKPLKGTNEGRLQGTWIL